MKITPEDMDDVREACNLRTPYHSIDYEARDTALALILGRIYDRGYNAAVEASIAGVSEECPYTMSHTRHWCGYAGCRDS